jgi:hypothetical protein
MFTIHADTNFLRLFELPEQYPQGFCFSGGKPTTFVLIDWFNPFFPQDGLWNGPKTLTHDERNDLVAALTEFIKCKWYMKAGRKYLAMTDYNDAFIIEGGPNEHRKTRR